MYFEYYQCRFIYYLPHQSRYLIFDNGMPLNSHLNIDKFIGIQVHL